MRLHRFIGDWDLNQKEIRLKNKENIGQIKNVLRLETGDEMLLSDGKGTEARVKIESIAKNEVLCSVLETKKTEEENRKVNLFLAILKKENFELAVQKAVEAGVSHIIPIITERTIKTGINMERLNKIILEASEQSGRSIVPTLFPTLNFKDALVSEKDAEEKIIFHLVESSYSPDTEAKKINIFIGPEGGFTEKEVKLAKDNGYKVASLGKNTLRGETAALVATYRAVNGI